MPTAQKGRAHLVGITPAGTVVFTQPGGGSLTGTISYNARSMRLVVNGELVEVSDEDGDIVGLVAGAESLQMDFTFIPFGTSIANATASHAVPQALATAVVSGFPVIPMGGYADAINTGAAGPWFVVPGSQVPFEAGLNPQGVTITMRRYPSITSAAVIT